MNLEMQSQLVEKKGKTPGILTESRLFSAPFAQQDFVIDEIELLFRGKSPMGISLEIGFEEDAFARRPAAASGPGR